MLVHMPFSICDISDSCKASIFQKLMHIMTDVFKVEVGNTPGGSIRSQFYFVKLDLSDIIVQALPSAQLTLTNSIARTLGLHDFYQVGLWNFCEGYKDRYDHFFPTSR